MADESAIHESGWELPRNFLRRQKRHVRIRAVMRQIYFAFLFVFLINAFGCSSQRPFSIFPSKSSKRFNPDDLVVKTKEAVMVEDSDAIKEGNVVDQLKLKNGGNVLVVPFSPGVNIEANDEFDRLTLRMIRAIADEFKDKNPSFTVLSSENAQSADFIIEGRVTEIRKPSLMDKMPFGNRDRQISVQGKMTERDSQKPVLIFTDRVVSKNNKEQLENLGTRIGQHIGRLVVTNSH